MIFPEKHFYVVPGLGIGIENYEFSVGLDPMFAKRFYDRELNDEEFMRISGVGKEIVKSYFNLENPDSPYYFLYNERKKRTALLQFCKTSGNACELSLDGLKLDRMKMWNESDMDSLIEYNPHNIDSRTQAFSLFGLWNQWAAYAYSITYEDN